MGRWNQDGWMNKGDRMTQVMRASTYVYEDKDGEMESVQMDEKRRQDDTARDGRCLIIMNQTG